jgi:hypothetical protein
MCPRPELVWTPRAGQPVIGRLGSKKVIGEPGAEVSTLAAERVGQEVAT